MFCCISFQALIVQDFVAQRTDAVGQAVKVDGGGEGGVAALQKSEVRHETLDIEARVAFQR